MTTRTPSVFLLCAASIGVVGCTPRLTEERVLEDLGKDELVFTFATLDERFIEQHRCAPSAGPIASSVEEERAAAEAVGWAEDVCKGDPGVMKLTPAGHRASTRWKSSDEPRAANELRSWWVVVARYQRTGPPVIRAGAKATERIVMIPGRWIPNEDGKHLYEAGWTPIRAENREEIFTYWDGVWARNHLGRPL